MIELDRHGLSQGQQIADLEKQGKVYGVSPTSEE